MTFLQERIRAKFERYWEAGRQRRASIASATHGPTHVEEPSRPIANIPSTIPDPLPSSKTNSLIYQSFEWYTHTSSHPQTSYWLLLSSSLPRLQHLGVSMLWLPPGCKAGNPKGNGYDIYDLWDLGEFDWKGQRPTKWGCKEELEALCAEARRLEVGVLWDAVLNHRVAADFSEELHGIKVDGDDRQKEIGKPRQITAWTGFDFPARNGKYSEFKLRAEHFNAIDWDDKMKERAIFKFCGEDGRSRGWAKDVDPEFGNFDYLMGSNLSYTSPALQDDVLAWGTWITYTLGLSGFRLDAIKHMSQAFVLEFITRMQQEFGSDFFFVGEYWKWDSAFLAQIIKRMEGRCRLYDVQLCYNFSDYSVGKKKDLRRVLESTLTELDAQHSVTVVSNHDTQPTQTLAVPFQPWFLPHAYSILLLRACSSLPCVFHGHLYGIAGPEPQPPLQCLPTLMLVRKHFAYGAQHNYWDDPKCIGWTRIGREYSQNRRACAVLLSNAKTVKTKRMFVGAQNCGAVFEDVLQGRNGAEVRIGDDGFGVFQMQPRSAGVWVRKDEAEHLLG